jgi:CelD/BcsL family acetyltransferase involved in cellulose biosynthesis
VLRESQGHGDILSVFEIRPLTDPRWEELLRWHPRAGIFHTSKWLAALQESYGYEPIAFTTSLPGEPLKNGVVFCEVKSWITGRRLVSLPFSDHCALLADSAAENEELLAHVCERVVREGYTHAEIRPITAGEAVPFAAANLETTETFCLHTLSLEPPVGEVFDNLHASCIQRKVQRAKRESLVYESGRSEELLRKFYQLLMRTRRRHCLPPQPLQWFRNLVDAMADSLTIRLASKDQCPVAAILTLSHKTTITFKYGCSDERFHSLGGTPFLFWKAIQEGKEQGMRELDLGRSELTHEGLIQFKDRLGAVRRSLSYWRYTNGGATEATRPGWQIQVAKGLISRLPDPILAASGRMLYRHVG